MNELQAAQERIVKLEQELASAKDRNHKLQEMLLSYVEDEMLFDELAHTLACCWTLTPTPLPPASSS